MNVMSALARTEVARALLPLGPAAVQRGHEVLSRVELIRVTDRILLDAGSLLPARLRSLDAIHIATMRQLGGSLRQVVTYDSRMAEAAWAMGMTHSGAHLISQPSASEPSVSGKCRRQAPRAAADYLNVARGIDRARGALLASSQGSLQLTHPTHR
ncbi:MAG: type II toxin-antitoxin system VapC family toxin [Chloroflexi bacterium]|nr:MAG: type II toxin-antitoxin system VapC family toxin [Chloroflexota bacterium]